MLDFFVTISISKAYKSKKNEAALKHADEGNEASFGLTCGKQIKKVGEIRATLIRTKVWLKWSTREN